MKKLLLILSFFLVVGLGACENAPTDLPNEDYVTIEQYEELDERLAYVESYLKRMVWQGYLLPEGAEGTYEEDTISASVQDFEFLSTMELAEKDYLDASKFPSYIFDESGNYINAQTLGNMLSQKYFGVDSTTTIGFQYKIVLIPPSNMSQSEIMSRLGLMLVELELYDFYLLDSNELYIQLNTGGSEYVKAKISLFTTDKYVFHPAMIWEGMLDTRLYGIDVTSTTVEGYYDDFVNSETFTGYVLPNYK